MSQPLSNKRNRGISVLFFAFFAVIGAALFYSFFPFLKIIDARTWNATPCVIQSSTVGRHSGSKGPTYSIDITFRYEVAGQSYLGKRYHFVNGTSSGRTGKAEIVARYPGGMTTTCYVNPRDPNDSVIERGLTPDMWFALIPLLFFGIGVGGMISTFRSSKLTTDNQWEPTASRHAAGYPPAAPGSRELKPSATTLVKLFLFAIFAVFWNGIVWLVFMEKFEKTHAGNVDWFTMLFSIPFVLVGIGMILATIYEFLALFNPRAHLTINPGSIVLGDAVALEWRLEGRTAALTSLRISMEGQEEATYESGKNSKTATHVFSTIEIVNTTNPPDFAAGRATLTLPRDTIHSFEARYNKITWKLKVKGVIPRWPDMAAEYPLIVMPLETKKSS